MAPDSLDVAGSLNNLGNVAEGRSDLAAAEGFHNRSLAINERVAPDSLVVATSLNNLGRVFRQRGSLEAAREYFCKAVDTLESQISRLGGSEATRSYFGALYGGYYRDCLEALIRANQPTQAFHVLERSRARSLLEMLAERDLVLAGGPPAELDRERRGIAADYERTQAAIATLHGANDATEIDRLLNRLSELREDQAELKSKIREASPHFAALQYPEPLDLVGVGRVLDPGTVLRFRRVRPTGFWSRSSTGLPETSAISASSSTGTSASGATTLSCRSPSRSTRDPPVGGWY